MEFASLRRRVVLVPQEGFLFDSTLLENVRYGDLDATRERGPRPRRSSSAWGTGSTGLPHGLDTRVGQRGESLSAGERQLVALLRAHLADPDLLVLDEATSAVDPALEMRIGRALERLMTGRTSVTIAHRLSTAENADEVIVFDQGRVVQRGSHTGSSTAGAYPRTPLGPGVLRRDCHSSVRSPRASLVAETLTGHSGAVRRRVPLSSATDSPPSGRRTRMDPARPSACGSRAWGRARWRRPTPTYAAAVRAYVARFVGESEADDVVQRTFLDVWRHASRYDPAERFTGWLFTIARRRAIDSLRSRRHEVVDVDQAPTPGGGGRARDRGAVRRRGRRPRGRGPAARARADGDRAGVLRRADPGGDRRRDRCTPRDRQGARRRAAPAGWRS